ncbi:hypothetical protein FHS16_006094 [Paenibacillus endophyticus]|uniref:Uncharacterized protein n=1 Tax=Paenibacillus endophyticus TaxID=1294268 RepID=A0A7W5GDZ7_9BACL|nr:hypothetical protein [Paenibacillus endophyticus]MBB3155978.1 hypothetical protein [Paenibacillus endophyticus]
MNTVIPPHAAQAVVHEPINIRTWRVGSLSMGVTLMLIGTALAVSLWQDMEAFEVLLWVAPVVFIMLGAELLLYLKFSNSNRTVVRYDWMSVFFVGAIGTVSLGLALLMSTGLFDELQRGLNMTQRTAFVETKTVKVPASINKIVVQAWDGIELDQTDARELQLIGQVRYRSSEKLDRLDSKIMQTEIIGSTMYVMVGAVDRRDSGLISDSVDTRLTLIVPKGVEVVEKGR